MSLVEEIEVSDLKQWLDTSAENVCVLDVRSFQDVSSGAIPNSTHFPLPELASRCHEMPLNKSIVLYSQLGRRSEQAYRFLKKEGYDNIFSLRGGFNAWQASGLDVT